MRATTLLISSLLLTAGCGDSGGSVDRTPAAIEPEAGSAMGVPLGAPEDLEFDEAGNLFISEWTGDRVVRVDASGMLTVVAGTGDMGLSGDGGPATQAELAAPSGLARDARGELAIADQANNLVRLVDLNGRITTIAGTGADDLTGDGGPAIEAALNDPIGIAFDAVGSLFVADDQNARIRRIDSDGVISTIAGGGETPSADMRDGAPATSASLSHPSYVVVDDAGNVYFSDFLDNVIWMIDPSGGMTRIAGTRTAGFSGEGGPAVDAELDFPTGLVLDDRGNLYVSDAENHRIRMIDRHGVITTVAGTGEAGSAGLGGPALDGQLNAPAGLAMGPDGLLYIADQGNDRVLRINAAGELELVAG